MTQIETRRRDFTVWLPSSARIPTALLIGIGSLAACSTPPSTAGLTPWDQTRVTQLSEQLREATNGWFVVLDQQGGENARLQQNAVALQQQSEALAAQLEAGKGFADTVDSYGDLRELMDDADEGVDQSFLEKPTQAAWAKLRGSMTQITPYYDHRPFGS